jgi:hypothetical protein
MKRNISGTHIFHHPENNEAYYVSYRGYYIPEKITSSPDNSYPAEGELTLIDLPAELADYEQLIKDDIWNYEI